MTTLREAIAAQIKAERAAAGLSRAAVAERSGLGVSTIQRLERGVRSPDMDQLEQLCAALGLPVVLLVERADARAHGEALSLPVMEDIAARHGEQV